MSATTPEAKPLCACCKEAAATCVDPHIGEVCGECFSGAHNVALAMESIAPQTGISGCREKEIR